MKTGCCVAHRARSVGGQFATTAATRHDHREHDRQDRQQRQGNPPGKLADAELHFSGRVALVTGAGIGIGRQPSGIVPTAGEEQRAKKARKEAQASECANELGGNQAFWAYADRLFQVSPANGQLDLALRPKIAEEIGLDRANFEAALPNGKPPLPAAGTEEAK